LPPTSASPEHTHAVIVGIERYRADDGWDLDGPLNDALAIRSWLLASGVPEDQLHLHVSELDCNQSKLQAAGVNPKEATNQALRQTFDNLRNLPASNTSLLIIYWAGHGVISNDRQCLFLSEATNTDMASYNLENLRTSFSTHICTGFPQQIFLLDTCRSFRHKYADHPPTLDLPVGNPTKRSQFVLFASQPGQPAKNLGEEKCGYFTKIFLEQLQADCQSITPWPPNMEAIANKIQEICRPQKAEQSAGRQYPTFYKVDWDGNCSYDSPPTDTAPAAEEELTVLEAMDQLAKLLAEHLGDPNQRKDLLNDFQYCGQKGKDIYGRAERRSDALSDYKQIIQTCKTYSGLPLLKKIYLRAAGSINARENIIKAFEAFDAALAKEFIKA
jgi:hypothetical protein